MNDLAGTSVGVAPPGDPADAAAALKQPRTVVAETTGLVALSVLSPLMGLAVETALAWRFGTSPVVDAYRVAVLLVLFGQQLFVTSVLPFVVVPIFAEYRARGNERDAWVATNSLGHVFLGLGVLIALCLFLFPDSATDLLAPGLIGVGRSTAVFFMRWCGLAFVPLCWSGIACGILYARHVFRVAPMAQLLSNGMLLTAIVAGGRALGPASIVIGVVGGAAASATLYAIRLAMVRRQFAPDLRAGHVDIKALRRLLRLAGPLVAGGIIGQVSGAVVARALSRLAAGSLAAFGYSWKLGQIVLLIPGALSTVLFPRLSEAFHSPSVAEFSESYLKALRALFFITVPMTFLAYSLREQIVKLLLQRGAFSTSAGKLTAAMFGLLILGAPGSAAATYLERMFYATQETTLPVMVNISCSLVAMTMVTSLAIRFGVGGIALIYMLLPWLNSTVLLVLFQYKHGGFPFRPIALFLIQTTTVACASTWLGLRSGEWLTSFIGLGMLPMLLSLACSTLVTGLLYLLGGSRLGLGEAIACRRHIARYTSYIHSFSRSH